jgi:hypothetical protein
LRFSRDSFSSFTARAIDTAPTGVDNAAIALVRSNRSLSGYNFLLDCRQTRH